MNKDLKKLQSRINITFHDPNLLRQAFTHSSYVNENRSFNIKDNERLEFLGDAVLELAVSEHLFHLYMDRSEGELTKLRASMVCEPSLMKLAVALHFGEYVLLGKGEEATGGRTRPALLADIFEAFVGALFIDQGMDKVKDFLSKHVFITLSADGKLLLDDYKTQLQEFTQQGNLGVLDYRIVAENGPAHDREFNSEVYLDDVLLGQGTGRSKKEAEQHAASKALVKLNKS